MAKKRRARARQETHRICNLEPSHNTESDWRFEHAVAASAVAVPRAAAPASVDLRASWWGIGDQEATGSCVGWSSTDGVARYHFVKAGRLAQNARLSPRFTWMASKETDTLTSRPETFIEGAGTTLKAAVDILRKYGAAPETVLPFHIAITCTWGTRIPSSLRRRRGASPPISIWRRTWRTGVPGWPLTARSWPGSAWTRPGITPPRRAANSILSRPTRSVAAMPSPSSATPPTVASSSETAGARPGEIVVSLMPVRRISMRASSMRATA